jgi:hypothetical protein
MLCRKNDEVSGCFPHLALYFLARGKHFPVCGTGKRQGKRLIRPPLRRRRRMWAKDFPGILPAPREFAGAAGPPLSQMRHAIRVR